jgi:drug/metabolite transporter (DMT)-like permease
LVNFIDSFIILNGLWLKSLVFQLQVAVAHTIGHVAATVSMSKVAVSFTHIIKSGEPAFSVLVSRFILGETFPVPVYLSLLPIIGGCALAAVTELNFNMIGNELDSMNILFLLLCCSAQY